MTLQGVVVVDDVDARGDADCLAGPAALEHVANRPIVHHVVDAQPTVPADRRTADRAA